MMTNSLGVNQKALLDKVARSKSGLSFKVLLHLQASTGLTLKQIGDAIDLPKSTMQLRRKSKSLSRHESDRLIRLGRLFDRTVDLFESDVPAAREWFCQPCRALGNVSPLELSSTEIGSREVEAVLDRLEHGVYT